MEPVVETVTTSAQPKKITRTPSQEREHREQAPEDNGTHNDTTQDSPDGGDSGGGQTQSTESTQQGLLDGVPDAEIAQWDALAQCESGGNWSIDTGNSFYGGLQHTQQTWLAFGGGEFAPLASQASREEQIFVARKVKASQGWGAWPACTQRLGFR